MALENPILHVVHTTYLVLPRHKLHLQGYDTTHFRPPAVRRNYTPSVLNKQGKQYRRCTAKKNNHKVRHEQRWYLDSHLHLVSLQVDVQAGDLGVLYRGRHALRSPNAV